MAAYEIINRTSGQSLGVYEGIDAEAAIREMLDDAGASDQEPSDELETIEVTRCAYCDALVPAGDVPQIDADEEWARLAHSHADGCEWIETRAHRIAVEG